MKRSSRGMCNQNVTIVQSRSTHPCNRDAQLRTLLYHEEPGRCYTTLRLIVRNQIYFLKDWSRKKESLTPHNMYVHKLMTFPMAIVKLLFIGFNLLPLEFPRIPTRASSPSSNASQARVQKRCKSSERWQGIICKQSI